MSGTSLRTVAWFGVALVPGLIILSLIWISVAADGISPVTHKLPVVDFANVWSAGKLARQGRSCDAVRLAYGLQAVATLCAVGLVAAIWGKPRASFTAPLVLLATPFAYTYDLVAFAVAKAIVAERRGWRIGPLTAIAWI